MAIARTLKSYLDRNNVKYDTVEHMPTETAIDSARKAHLPTHQVTKAVVLEDDNGYVVSVLPADHRLNLDWVNDELARNLELAPEDELPELFQDCKLGAVPALSEAYGLDVIWDDQLVEASDIYIEAGDHEHLIHMRGDAFQQLMAAQPHSVISTTDDAPRWISE